MTVDRQRTILTLTWWISAAILTVAVALLAIANGLADASAAWSIIGWFLPNIVPTLTLVSAIGTGAQEQARVAPEELGRRFMVALCASLFYLLLLTGSVLLLALYHDPDAPQNTAVDAVHQAGLLLAPFQGLAASALGGFFAKTTPNAKTAPAPASAPG